MAEPLRIILLALFTLIALLPLLARPAAPLLPLSKGLVGISRRIVTAMFSISAVAALLLVLSQVAAITSRNVFGVNFIWLQESANYFFAGLFLLSSAGILLRDGHVRVDVFYSSWSEGRKRLVDLLGLYLFVLPVCLLTLYASTPYVIESWRLLEGSPEANGIDAVFLLKTLIPTFAALLCLAIAVRTDELLSGPGEAAR